jgi:hypothetical protein
VGEARWLTYGDVALKGGGANGGSKVGGGGNGSKGSGHVSKVPTGVH